MLDGGTLRDFFAAVCHQIESRSLGVGEAVMPLCARCAGLYDGILVAGLWYALQRSLGWKPRLSGATLSFVATVAAVCVVDGATGASHAMGAPNLVRFVLGLAAGLAIGVALLHHFTRPWRERRVSFWIPSSEALLLGLVLTPPLIASAASVVGFAALGVAAALGLALLHGAAFVTALVVARRTWEDPGWPKRSLHRPTASALGLVLSASTIASAQSTSVGAAQWSPLGHPPDGENRDAVVRTLVVDPGHPDTLWIGLDGEGHRHHGIFKTNRRDSAWVRVYAGEHFDSWSIAFARSDPSAVYAASDKHTLIRSVDGGANWSVIPAADQIEAIAVDPGNALVLYAVRAHGWGGMKTTTAGGGSWEDFGRNTWMTCIAIAPQDPSRIYVGTRHYDGKQKAGLIRSSDRGRTWARVFDGGDVLAVAVDALDSDVVYIGTLDHGLFRSRDGGATWQSASRGITLPSIAAVVIDPENPGVVYAGTRGDGVFRSEDGGANWQSMNHGLTDLRVTALAIDPRDTRRLYVGTTAGLFTWGQPETPAARFDPGGPSGGMQPAANVPPRPLEAGQPFEPGGVPGGVQPSTNVSSVTVRNGRPPRSPLLHPYLPPVFIALVIVGSFWFRKKRIEAWNKEKENLRSALLSELRLPKNGDAAARKSVLALLTATKDTPGGEELWLALLSDRIVAIHKDGRRTTVPVKNLKKLDLVEFSGADFGIAIDTTGGKTDIDGRLRLAGAADMVRIVNILIRQGVSVAYRKA